MSELERRSMASPNMPQLVDKVRDAITVQRVFGDPIERDGVTVIPAAYVGGGGGGGGGTDETGNVGGGSGFGVKARPAGALVIRDGDARWEPAVDPERRILAGAAVAVIGILAVRSLLRRRGRRRRR